MYGKRVTESDEAPQDDLSGPQGGEDGGSPGDFAQDMLERMWADQQLSEPGAPAAPRERGVHRWGY